MMSHEQYRRLLLQGPCPCYAGCIHGSTDPSCTLLASSTQSQASLTLELLTTLVAAFSPNQTIGETVRQFFILKRQRSKLH
jgi:hypothetical protein